MVGTHQVASTIISVRNENIRVEITSGTFGWLISLDEQRIGIVIVIDEN
jgi:hypothetical protein